MASRLRKSKATGARAAKLKRIEERPEKLRTLLAQEPLEMSRISEALRLKDSDTVGRVLTVLKRAGDVSDWQIGNTRLWATAGSQAEEQCKRLRAEREQWAAAQELARWRKQCEKRKAQRAEERAKWAQAMARPVVEDESDDEGDGFVHVVVPADQCTVSVPPGAVRSVFDLGLRCAA